jgi:hypothetical protein
MGPMGFQGDDSPMTSRLSEFLQSRFAHAPDAGMAPSELDIFLKVDRVTVLMPDGVVQKHIPFHFMPRPMRLPIGTDQADFCPAVTVLDIAWCIPLRTGAAQ